MPRIPSKYNVYSLEAASFGTSSDSGELAAHLSELGFNPEARRKIAEGAMQVFLKLEGLKGEAAGNLESLLAGREARMIQGEVGSEALIIGSRNALMSLAALLKEHPELSGMAEEISICLRPPNRKISWADRELDFRSKTYVMGVLNCTPDSFFPGSRLETREAALRKARELIQAEVDILDIGGESSRPGSESVSIAEEIRRVIPVIHGIRQESDILISIDTQKSVVAEEALDAGADLVNDISGLRTDGSLAKLIASRGVPVILMHMRGTPKTMQENPSYCDTIGEIIRELRASMALAAEAGISRERIIIDPGIGFGKRLEDNLRILKYLRSFSSLGAPILIGLSRKSFIGKVLDAPVEERLIGTIAANTAAVLHGADIVRVHDGAEAVDMARIIDAIGRIGPY